LICPVNRSVLPSANVVLIGGKPCAATAEPHAIVIATPDPNTDLRPAIAHPPLSLRDYSITHIPGL
jgi:hypothetical protein